MWGSSVTREQLKKAIEDLERLNDVPQSPQENELLSRDGRDETYKLSASRENEIAGNLAFLSATTDDRERVMAVCIEEFADGTGLIIRVASNTGNLSEIKEGFQTLARILEQAARRSKFIYINTCYLIHC